MKFNIGNSIPNDQRVTDFFLICYFLFLILWPVASIVSLVLLTVYFVFTGKIEKSFRRIKSDPVLLIFIGYYLLHVVGMTYTSDLDYGLADLQTKLSFILV